MFYTGRAHYNALAAEWRNMFYGDGTWLKIGACMERRNGEWLHRVLDDAAAKVAAWPESKRQQLKSQINDRNT